MNISRYMNERLVKLEMSTEIDPPEEGMSIEKWRQQSKEKILHELVELLEENSRVGNRNKLLFDFINREKKASTGIGGGVAIPHIRSKHATEFMMAFARSTKGYDFDALDGEPTHLILHYGRAAIRRHPLPESFQITGGDAQVRLISRRTDECLLTR